jgi:hypothetical protein
MPVSQDHRAEAETVVYVAVAIKVPDVGSLGAGHANILPFTPVPKVGRYAKREYPVRTFEKSLGLIGGI